MEKSVKHRLIKTDHKELIYKVCLTFIFYQKYFYGEMDL